MRDFSDSSSWIPGFLIKMPLRDSAVMSIKFRLVGAEFIPLIWVYLRSSVFICVPVGIQLHRAKLLRSPASERRRPAHADHVDIVKCRWQKPMVIADHQQAGGADVPIQSDRNNSLVDHRWRQSAHRRLAACGKPACRSG